MQTDVSPFSLRSLNIHFPQPKGSKQSRNQLGPHPKKARKKAGVVFVCVTEHQQAGELSYHMTCM